MLGEFDVPIIPVDPAVVFLELALQRVASDAQSARGLALVAIHRRQNALDVSSLELLEGKQLPGIACLDARKPAERAS